MKKTFLAACLFAGMAQLSAQTASSTKVEFQKKMFQGATIDVPYEQSVTEDAIDLYMAKKGSKGKNASGYRVYKNVSLSGTSSDVYIDVAKKSKRETTSSSIFMIACNPNEPIANKTEDDAFGQKESVEFLNNLVAEIRLHKADVDIETQEDVVKKTGKKLESLQSDKSSYEKKLASTKTKLQKNNEDIKAQQSEVLKLSDTAVIHTSADALQKQKKKLLSLQDDTDDYAKKITDLENKLKTTNNDITKTQSDLQAQRDALQKLQDGKKKLLSN